MKTRLTILSSSIVAILLVSSANAQELNVGKETPSATEIISHFTAPAANAGVESASEATENSGDDISEQIGARKSRSLIMRPVEQAAKKVAQHAGKAKAPIIDMAAIPSKTQIDEVAFSMEVLFDYNSANLSSKAKEQLVPVAQALLSPEMKGLRFKIEGHTDAVGADEYNVSLSLRRAEAVKEYLTQQYGVEGSAIAVEGKGKYGLANPVDPASEANRRVRLVKLGS